MSLYANNINRDSTRLSTGEVVKLDSVLIAYDDLRIVNSKLIELEYEKEVNKNLYNIIHNDSIIINDYKIINNKISVDCKKAIKQRNIVTGICCVLFVGSIFLLLK